MGGQVIHVPKDARPVLLGMNNPLSSDPAHALYPHPPGCTGWRLWEMLNERVPLSKTQYLRTFDRRNLVDKPKWSKQEARDRGRWLREFDLRGREVVVLGNEPRDALLLPPKLIEPQLIEGITWRQIPHPSGRNLWYNDPHNRMLVAVLLEQLYSSVPVRAYS
jgi:hypothetical protein